MYFPDEDSYFFVIDIFSSVSKFKCIDELANNFNEVGLKALNGLPYSRGFITTVISDPFYINLLERKINGKNRYVVEVFESIITIEEWVLAQVAIENWEILKLPDIRSHISNSLYHKETLKYANLIGKKTRKFS